MLRNWAPGIATAVDRVAKWTPENPEQARRDRNRTLWVGKCAAEVRNRTIGEPGRTVEPAMRAVSTAGRIVRPGK
jgi:hypothetical protein